MKIFCQPVLLVTVLLVIHVQASTPWNYTPPPGSGVHSSNVEDSTTVRALEDVSLSTLLLPRHRAASERRQRQQQRQEKRRLAKERRSNHRGRNRRQREHHRRMRGRMGAGSLVETDQPTVDVSWLAANLSALWETVHHIEGFVEDIVQKNNLTVSANPSSESDVCDSTECSDGDAPCRATDQGEVCSGSGTCCCGQCQCQEAHYGRYCECNDHDCDRHDCSGHGDCSCGQCYCYSGYEGASCECPVSSDNCTDPHNGLVCNNNGMCLCGVCSCQNGYNGRYCEETSYLAGLCEELKPCVLCNAYGKTMPQCSMCSHVNIQTVHHLEPSNKMCRMVHSGCLLQYYYQRAAEGRYDVSVPEDSTCN